MKEVNPSFSSFNGGSSPSEFAEADGAVQIELTLTSPMCPLGPEIVAAVRAAAESLPDVSVAEVQLVWSPLWDPRVDASEEGKAELGIWD